MSLTGTFLTWGPQSLPQCCCRVLVCALGQSCWAQPCHWGTTWAGPGPGSPPGADPIPAPGLGRLLALSIAWQEHRKLHLKKIPKRSQSYSENIYRPSVEVLLQTNSLVASLFFLSTSTAMYAKHELTFPVWQVSDFWEAACDGQLCVNKAVPSSWAWGWKWGLRALLLGGLGG